MVRLAAAALAAALLLPAPARAQATDDEDDPAFARKKPAPPPLPDEEPFPDAAALAAEDPAFGEPPPSGEPDETVTRRAPRRRPTFRELEGTKLRVGYRTFAVPELASPEATHDSRFHGVSLDAYPISEVVRLGLSTQLAFEGEKSDWVATEGLVLGVQRLGRAWTPWFEVGLHVGVGYRTMAYIDDETADLTPATTDALTILWAYGAELGVDGRLAGRVLGSFALGIQRTSYFGTEFTPEGEEPMALGVQGGLTVTLKVGIGY